MGGCERNIYGGTPVEILHAVLLDLCDYITDGIKLTFTGSSIPEISNTTAKIYKESRRQSERDIPYLEHFRKRLMSVKLLKAKDRFGRMS